MQPLTKQCPTGTVRQGRMCMPKTTKGKGDSPTPTITAPEPRATLSPTPKPTPKSAPTPTPPSQSRISPSAQAIATAPTPKGNPLSGTVYTPRPLLTASKLTPAQIENAKLVSISYMINAQMHEQEGTVENAMFDGTDTLVMNNLDDYEMVNNLFHERLCGCQTRLGDQNSF